MGNAGRNLAKIPDRAVHPLQCGDGVDLAKKCRIRADRGDHGRPTSAPEPVGGEMSAVASRGPGTMLSSLTASMRVRGAFVGLLLSTVRCAPSRLAPRSGREAGELMLPDGDRT
jgi:hypothetical protein